MSKQRQHSGIWWLSSWRRNAPAGTILVVLTLFAPSASLAQDAYGAIAYSSSNGAYGYSYDWGARGRAERQALLKCSARQKLF